MKNYSGFPLPILSILSIDFSVLSCDCRARFKYLSQLVDVRSDATLRQTLQEQAAVALGFQPRVEHREHVPVASATYQSSQALFQTDDRLRHAVLKKTRAAFVLNVALARGDNRIGWHRKRQFIDNHTRQLFAAHVNSLPETCGGKQSRVWSLTKPLEQTSLRCTALDETRIVNLRHGQIVKRLHARQTSRQHKRTPFSCADDLNHLGGGSFGPLTRTRIGHLRRQIQQRLPLVVER